MLRITQSDRDGHGSTLKLEGKLVEPWLDEVRALVGQLESVSNTSLDLSHLTYVDAAGTELLRQLIEGGLRVESCTSFIAALLQSQRETTR